MAESYVVPENKRLLVAVCYVIPLLGGIVLLLIAEGNRALKFHAFQALILGLGSWILGGVTFMCLGCLGFILWLYCVYGAYIVYTTGDWHSFIADFIENSIMK